MPWAIFFSEFLILFLTSRFLFKSFFALLYFVFRSQKAAIFLISGFFLPGVLVHELAHLIVAELLRVRTHGIEFVPELTGASLKMGSVKVEKSDILRSLLIGIAPVVVGITLLTLSIYILGRVFSYSQIFSSVLSFVTTMSIGYVVFVVANTMFSSKKDIEGFLEALIIGGIIVGALYFMGLSPHAWLVMVFGTKQVMDFIRQVDLLLTVPVGINVVVVMLSLPLLKKLHLN